MEISSNPHRFLNVRKDLAVLAIGLRGGQPRAGVDNGPAAIMEAGIISQIEKELHYNVHNDPVTQFYEQLAPGTDPDYRGMRNPLLVSAVTREIATTIYGYSSQGCLSLTLGGDHSLAIGTVSGVAKATRERLGRDLAVIWVDAHADINTPEDSISGNIHGMPLSFLTGLARDENEQYFGWIQREMRISTEKLVYIGLRDLDNAEKITIRDNGIKAFTMFDINRYGIGRVMDMALNYIGTDTPIHLSFDIDALDPMWTPCTGTPVRGGLTSREGNYICQSLHQTGNLVAIDLVEVNPHLATTTKSLEETAVAACSLIALGDTYL